jgi:acyl-homoserine lactone acylase PvdQ
MIGMQSIGMLSAPSEWYLAMVKVIDDNGRTNVIGSTIPGIFGWWNGRNDFYSWNNVIMNADVMDLYVIQENIPNVNYNFQNGLNNYITRNETIILKSGFF